MKILLAQTTPDNIGNKFIQKGAKAMLRRAFPEAQILEADGFPTYRSKLVISLRDHICGMMKQEAMHVDLPTSLKNMYHQLRERRSESGTQSTPRTANLSELYDPDCVVVSGCVLHRGALSRQRQQLHQLDEIPTVMLGVGGKEYSPETQEYVRSVLTETGVDCLFSRDASAYDAYADAVPFSYEGIDCAFFLDEWYTPPEADRVFTTATFDRIEEPTISTDLRVIRPSHNHPAYGDLSARMFMRQKNGFVSDDIKEYLFLYANTKETHSDRVHACVPTLIYGNPAQLYHSSPRHELFEQVFDKDITREPLSVDRDRLDSLKDAMVSKLKHAITDACETC